MNDPWKQRRRSKSVVIELIDATAQEPGAFILALRTTTRG